MGKGYIKLYRSEANIPQLWESAALFCAYQKLKIVALWPEGTIKRPTRVLARQLAMSVNTLRKAVAGLAELGLVEVDLSEKNTWALRVKYVEREDAAAQIAPQIGPKPATGVNLLNPIKNVPESVLDAVKPVLGATGNPENETEESAPEAVVSKNDTPLCQNLIQVVSKFDTEACQNLTHPPYDRNIFINNIYKTPIIPQNPSNANDDFAAFWSAYPNKKGKQPALKKWNGAKYDLAAILPVLERQKKLRDWVKADGKFVPHAKTYLNQRRFEDVLPDGEEAYILDFKQPKTEREMILYTWLEATNPALLKNDNQKINSTLEPDRVLFEQIVAKCGGNLQAAFKIMRHGWQLGCTSLRAIAARTAAYMDDLTEDK